MGGTDSWDISNVCHSTRLDYLDTDARTNYRIVSKSNSRDIVGSTKGTVSNRRGYQRYTMTERVMEYRLSWEMPVDSWKLVEVENQHGKSIWPTYDWDTLGEWGPIEIIWREDGEKDHLDQYATLKQWAEERKQPIKNVKLEWRPVDLGEWEPVEEDDDRTEASA